MIASPGVGQGKIIVLYNFVVLVLVFRVHQSHFVEADLMSKMSIYLSGEVCPNIVPSAFLLQMCFCTAHARQCKLYYLLGYVLVWGWKECPSWIGDVAKFNINYKWPCKLCWAVPFSGNSICLWDENPLATERYLKLKPKKGTWGCLWPRCHGFTSHLRKMSSAARNVPQHAHPATFFVWRRAFDKTVNAKSTAGGCMLVGSQWI